MHLLSPSLPYQQVVQQDWHHNEEDDPENVGHFWEGGLQAIALTVVSKHSAILKLPKGHHHGLDEGETSIPKGGDIGKQGGTVWLQWAKEIRIMIPLSCT